MLLPFRRLVLLPFRRLVLLPFRRLVVARCLLLLLNFLLRILVLLCRIRSNCLCPWSSCCLVTLCPFLRHLRSWCLRRNRGPGAPSDGL